MIYVSGIPARYIDDVWPECSKYVEMGINKSQEEMDTHDTVSYTHLRAHET